jgi:hypothetical protein
MEKYMKNTIKIFLLGLSFMMSQVAWSGCESTIVNGSHTAATKKEAKLGALEEAVDACYPGVATKLDGNCDKQKDTPGNKLFQCVREVSCNTCGDDLQRKYEALN